MGTTPTPPAADSALATLLKILEASNTYVSLGVTIAGVAVPLIKGLIAKIEGIGTGNVSISFSDLVAQDSAELDAIVNLADDDLAAVNAELTRLGLPTLPTTSPAAPSAPATTEPAPGPTAAPPTTPAPAAETEKPAETPPATGEKTE